MTGKPLRHGEGTHPDGGAGISPPEVLARAVGRWPALLLLLLASLLSVSVHAAPTFPKLTGRVVDAANIIPDDEEARLTQKLEALEVQSKRQLVVVTLPDLQGYEISDYGYQLGRAWGIGRKDANDGALLIVAPTERKVRIEAGYGLEGTLTDGVSFMIISQVITPRFKAGDLPGGIEAGTDALIRQLSLPADQAQQVAAQADAAHKKNTGGGGFPVGALIPLIFIFLFVILPMMRGRGRRSSGFGGGLGQVILWDALSHMGGRGGGGGDGWGGGGGGGGFSGGGGSFGGGGSSGSW